MKRHSHRTARGSFLIEVMVALVVLAVGLLGLAGLQARSQQAEGESYQRAQAITVLNEMVGRMTSNKLTNASGTVISFSDYVDYDYGGDPDICDLPASPTLAQRDRCAWHRTLIGGATSLVIGTDEGIGVIRLARGCVSDVGSSTYRVEVAWYAQTVGTRPGDDLTCGQGLGPIPEYRRVISAIVQSANLGVD